MTMFERVKRQNDDKAKLINEMIELEWLMFDKVQNLNGRASCQDDAWTFYVMRYSQFRAWSMSMLSSYRQDLQEAVVQGRNLLTEKYAYMMAYTAPDIYESDIKPRLPMISHKKELLVEGIVEWMIADDGRFAQKYPNLAAKSRPLTDSSFGDVSVYHYAKGELKTYSLRTLMMYETYLSGLEETVEGGLAVQIYESMISFYGYSTLEQANARMASA